MSSGGKKNVIGKGANVLLMDDLRKELQLAEDMEKGKTEEKHEANEKSPSCFWSLFRTFCCLGGRSDSEIIGEDLNIVQGQLHQTNQSLENYISINREWKQHMLVKLESFTEEIEKLKAENKGLRAAQHDIFAKLNKQGVWIRGLQTAKNDQKKQEIFQKPEQDLKKSDNEQNFRKAVVEKFGNFEKLNNNLKGGDVKVTAELGFAETKNVKMNKPQKWKISIPDSKGNAKTFSEKKEELQKQQQGKAKWPETNFPTAKENIINISIRNVP